MNQSNNYNQTDVKKTKSSDNKIQIVAIVILAAILCVIFSFVVKSFTLIGCDIDDFKLKINGTVYSLPERVNKFQKNGWEFEYAEDAYESVSAGDYDYATMVLKDNEDIFIDLWVYNPSDNTVTMNECIVYCVDIQHNEDYADQFNVELPKGVKLGVSNIDKVVSEYGKSTYGRSYDDELHYSKKSGKNTLEIKENEAELELVDGVLSRIKIICIK